MPFNRTILAVAFVALSLMPVRSEDASLKPTVTPVLDSGVTIIGQPVAYPTGTAEVTASVITIPPGGETGWHLHAVPLFGYILEGTLTVDYRDKGTHTYTAGEGLLEAIDWLHNGMNKGTVPVRILAVYVGAQGIPDSETLAR